jgi:hypothetical protein
MVLTAVFALAAIGLGIWAFTTKSDLDDANATIDKQKQQLASAQAGAARQERAERAFGERAVRAYRRVRRRLLRARGQERNLEGKINQEVAQLKQAQSDVASARTDTEKEAAQLKAAQERGDLAGACARGAVAAVSEFFDAESARVGANRAVHKLEAIQDECDSAIKS